MPMTYAGRPFVQPNPELQVKLDRWWEEHAPELWDHRGYALERLHHLPIPDRPPIQRARLNTLYWPTGASRWGVFHGLMRGSDLALVQAQTSVTSPVPKNLVIGTGGVTASMYLLAARPVWVRSSRAARIAVSGTNLIVSPDSAITVFPDGYVPQNSDVGKTITITGPNPPWTPGPYTIDRVVGGAWVLSASSATFGTVGGVWSSNITTTTPDASRRLYWVTLVDARYHWWNNPNTFTFAAGVSWATLLSNLVYAASRLSPNVPIVPIAYGTPSPLRWGGVVSRPLPLLIDAAAASVGFRFVAALNGSYFDYVDAVTAQANDLGRYDQYDSRVVMGGRILAADVVGNIPAAVSVVFWGDYPTATTVTLATLTAAGTLTGWYETITGVAGKSAWVGLDQNDFIASPTHAAAATQAATDYYRWALSLTDATFRGTITTQSCGTEDRIEWEYVPGGRTRIEDDSVRVENPIDPQLPWERVVTRIVPTNWHDRNLYGDRPPPGYTYPVRLTATNGTAWKANIRIVSAGAVADGPKLGWGLDDYVLYSDSIVAPAPGDRGTAVPDAFVPNRWIFERSTGGGGSGSGSGSGGGSGGGSACAGVRIQTATTCIAGVLRVTTALLTNVGTPPCPTLSALVTTSQGCCACPTGSGSGSGSVPSGSGGGGSTFVPCCVNPVPNTLHVQFSGALVGIGTVAIQNLNGGTTWRFLGDSVADPYACATGGFTCVVTCSGSYWSIAVTYNGTNGSSGSGSVSGVVADSCDPLQITFSFNAATNGTPASACFGNVVAVVTL